ncbi:MAG: hypothetical protein Q9191_007938 [Dirinaria sp. TL-2023a]
MPTANPTATISAAFTPVLVLVLSALPPDVNGSIEGLGVAPPPPPPPVASAVAAESCPVALGYSPAPLPGARGTGEVGARLRPEEYAPVEGKVVGGKEGSVEMVRVEVPSEGSVEAAGSEGSVDAAGSAVVKELTAEELPGSKEAVRVPVALAAGGGSLPEVLFEPEVALHFASPCAMVKFVPLSGYTIPLYEQAASPAVREHCQHKAFLMPTGGMPSRLDVGWALADGSVASDDDVLDQGVGAAEGGFSGGAGEGVVVGVAGVG